MTVDFVAPPGNNYVEAAFRLWLEDDPGVVRGVLVLMPGSEYDGRPWVTDPYWQSLARRHGFALLATYFIDKPHKDMNIEEYVNVSDGSGDALLGALVVFAECTRHGEIATAPLAFWGFSAGGEFNYEFAAWAPDRVIAFVVNKGGIYYTALTPAASRKIPGMLFVGERDTEFRIKTILGLFAVNRETGALWAFAPEPGVGHEIGQTKQMGGMFLDRMIPLRLPERRAEAPKVPVLRPIDEQAGYIGDLITFAYHPVSRASDSSHLTAFLPDGEVARAWAAFCRGEAVE